MTEKELMQLVLKNEEPDFDRIERNCLKEFDKKTPSRPRWIYAAAAVMLLAVLSVFILRNYGNRNLSVSPIEQTSEPTSSDEEQTSEFPAYDSDQWFSYVAGISGGAGDDDIPYPCAYQKNGTIFENYADIDGVDYEPKLLTSNILKYTTENFRQNKDAMKEELLEKLKEYANLAGFDFNKLKETDEEELPENNYHFRELWIDTGGIDYFACFYALDADFDGQITITFSPEGDYLNFHAGTDIVEETRALAGTGREDEYTKLLSGNRFYEAFLKLFGIANAVCESEGTIWYAPFSTAFVYEAGESESEIYDRHLVQKISIMAQFYVSYPEGEDVAFINVNRRVTHLFGGEVVSPPAGVKPVSYEEAKKEAIEKNEDGEFAGARISYALSGDKKYCVPCYLFYFIEEKTEEEAFCKSIWIPAYDFSEYYFLQMQ